MAARDIVTQGFGSWQSDAHYIVTRGLDAGVSLGPWTVQTPASGGWGNQAPSGSVWTVQTPNSGNWAA